MSVSRVLLVLFALLLHAPSQAKAADAPGAIRLEVYAAKDDPTAGIAIDRLRAYAGGAIEVVFAADSPQPADRSTVRILLGESKGSPELVDAWNLHRSAKPDSYLVKTLSASPPVIVASGIDARGTLYAAYDLAGLLRAKADLTRLDRFFQPRIAQRFVSFGATTHGRGRYRPELHWKTLSHLPRFGYSGVVLYPGGGTPIGRRSSPIVEAEDGQLSLDPENTAQWNGWLAEIRKYRLDLMMTVPPAVPPGYSAAVIRDYYAGGPEPQGYLADLRVHFRRYLELLKQGYADLDLYMFNSTEGATFGRSQRFFGHPDEERFSTQGYLANNATVMKAYLDVLVEVFRDEPQKLCFWTHSFGLTSDGIARMREVLSEYPSLTVIEDDFWNNNLWPYDLPAMAYLPEDLRARSGKTNPLALFQIATDGEYFGGGSLPNAYPGSHIRSANEALQRGARMVIQRLDLHDRTEHGTAFGTMEIVPLAASRQLWEPTPAEPQIWQEWATQRFGRDAAPLVVKALRESHTILVKGLSCNGIDLLAVGSEMTPRLWIADGRGLSRFYLFGKPGRRLVDKRPGDVIYSGEYTAWQMNTRTISIDQYRRDQAEARQAAERGLEQIEQARPHLAEADYAMLRAVFADGLRVLEALRLLGEAAYATHLQLDNFDHVDNPTALFEKSIADLERFIATDALLPAMQRNLAQIARNYRQIGSRSE